MINKINNKLLLIKAHFFIFNAGTAPAVLFLPTLAKQLGFSSSVVGFMYGVVPILGMVAKCMFGLIADRAGKHKLMLIVFQMLTACTFLCIMFIPPIHNAAFAEFKCSAGVFVRCCPNKSTDNIPNSYKNTIIQNDFIRCKICNSDLVHLELANEYNISDICKNLGYRLNISYTHMFDNRNQTLCEIKQPLNKTKYINNIDRCSFVEMDLSTSLLCTNCSLGDIFGQFENEDIKIDNEVSNIQFWLLFVLLGLCWIGMAVVVSIGDAVCFGILDGRADLYGQQRLWGSVGGGLFSILLGIIVDQISGNSILKDYSTVFILAVIFMVSDAFVSKKFQYEQPTASENILKDVCYLLRSVKLIAFFAWCIGVGLCTALIWNFLYWYLEEIEQNQNKSNNTMKTLQGLTMAVQCFGGEIPFFFVSGKVIKAIGHEAAMNLVLFAFVLRFFFYSLLTNAWWVLPIELLHGFTFGIFYATMTSYINFISSSGTEATLQGLAGAIFEGIGVSAGSFIAGILFDTIGGRCTFQIYALCAFIFLTIRIVINWFWKSRQNNNLNCKICL